VTVACIVKLLAAKYTTPAMVTVMATRRISAITGLTA
jgi:hypothetical protein